MFGLKASSLEEDNAQALVRLFLQWILDVVLMYDPLILYTHAYMWVGNALEYKSYGLCDIKKDQIR